MQKLQKQTGEMRDHESIFCGQQQDHGTTDVRMVCQMVSQTTRNQETECFVFHAALYKRANTGRRRCKVAVMASAPSLLITIAAFHYENCESVSSPPFYPSPRPRTKATNCKPSATLWSRACVSTALVPTTASGERDAISAATMRACCTLQRSGHYRTA
jgi:hypothetical protein